MTAAMLVCPKSAIYGVFQLFNVREIIGSRPQSKEQWKLQLTFMLGAGVLAFISIISGGI